MEDEVMEIVFSCKEFPTILELHNKYFNKLLGKEVLFTYKSFKMLMWDTYINYTNDRDKLITLEFYINDHDFNQIDMQIKYRNIKDKMEINNFCVLDEEDFYWKSDLKEVICKYE